MNTPVRYVCVILDALGPTDIVARSEFNWIPVEVEPDFAVNFPLANCQYLSASPNPAFVAAIRVPLTSNPLNAETEEALVVRITSLPLDFMVSLVISYQPIVPALALTVPLIVTLPSAVK